MDAESQGDHLKAYGIVYYALENQLKVTWLLNYRGGLFNFRCTEPSEGMPDSRSGL